MKIRAARIISPVLLMLMLTMTVHAADPGYWYYDDFGIPEAYEQGIDGSGIKIADIDTLINLDVPWLADANVVVRDEAITTYYGEGISPLSDDFNIAYHATDMVSLLVGNSDGATVGGAPDGIAKGATIYHYAAVCSEDDSLTGGDVYEEAVPLALADDVDIILVPAGGLSFYERQYPYFLEAIRRNIPVFIAHANMRVSIDEVTVPEVYEDADGNALAYEELPTGDDDDEVCYWPGLVTIQAIGEDRLLQSFSDVEDAGTNLAAPGEDLWMQAEGWGIFVPRGGGCSAAATVTAGYCALAMQKWPDATGNQILQLMVRTASRQDGTLTGDPADVLSLERDPYEGFGIVDPVRMLAQDPSVLPDVNPILYLDIAQAVKNAEARGDGDALTEPELLVVAEVLDEQLAQGGFERPAFLITLLGERVAEVEEEEAESETAPAGEEAEDKAQEQSAEESKPQEESAQQTLPAEEEASIRSYVPLIVLGVMLIIGVTALVTLRSKKKQE